MNLAQEFNAIHGTIVNRKTLDYLLARAEKERHELIQTRIVKVLEAHPEKDEFKIELKSLIEPYGLNGAELEYFDEDGLNESVESTGLNGIPQQEIYDLVTNQLIENLENSKRWDKGQVDTKGTHINALNFHTKKPYRGINQLLLGGNPLLGTTLENPYYLTFKQVEKLGGKIDVGAKSKDAIFYTIVYNYKGFRTNDRQKFIEHLRSIGISSENEIKNLVFSCGYGIIRIYNVFNGKDITGIDFKLNPVAPVEKVVVDKIEICEKIIEKYPSPKPVYKFGGKDAFYNHSDFVQMPKPEVYKDIRTYYSVFFHELIHSTGHPNRLNRTFGKRFGDKNYALEELVAEIGACFLSANAGILYFTKENSKSYIKSWRNGIVKFLKTNNKGIFIASGKAQKAVDFMLTNITEKDYEVREKILVKPAEKDKKKSKKEVKKSVKKKETTIKKSIEVKGKDQKKTGIISSVKLVGKRISIPSNKRVFESLNAPAEQTEENVIVPTIQKEMVSENRSSLAYKMANRNTNFEYFDIQNNDISDFLGQIEIKEKESIVISLTGGQGSMKTRFAFQFMNALAQKYNCGHASIEEHPESKLYFDKADQYLNDKALNNIEAPEIKNISDLDKLIQNNDVVIIDSYAKMQEIEKGFEVDKDLRKKYNGKLFLVIFQQTSDGKMRGGSKSQFDADIVLFTEKKDDYKNNYVYADKNRYQSKSLDSLHFNIFSGKLNKTNGAEPAKEIGTKVVPVLNGRKLSFKIN